MDSLSSLYLGVIVPATTFIPISMGFYHYRQLNGRQRALLWYLCMAVTVNAIASIYSHRNNLPLLHVYTMLEFILLIRYYVLLLKGRRARHWLVAAGIIFPLACVINFLFIQSIYSFNSYTRPVEAILLVCCSLYYFITTAVDDEYAIMNTSTNQVASWASQPDNWVNAGILLYFSGALAQFAFSNVVDATASPSIKLLIWVLHATLVLIMYILFTISFSKCSR